MSDNNDREIHEAIEAVYHQISKAFADQDIKKALSYFADHEDMVKVSNGHVSRGKSELADYWKKRIGGVRDLHIDIRNIKAHVIDSLHAWAVADEFIAIDGEVQKAIVSNIFLLEDSQWKILLDHTTFVAKVKYHKADMDVWIGQ